MAKPKKEQTAVFKWLQENHADEFSDDFYAQGYYEVEDVDPESIKNILGEGQGGLVNRLKNSLVDRKEQEQKKATLVTPPPLPPNTILDLSAPSIKTPDGNTFSVSKSLSVASNAAAIEDPNKLSREEWMVIARGALLLYAYNMDGSEPVPAEKPVLDWKVPDTTDFVQSATLRGNVSSVTTYSEQTSQFIKQGFDEETASASFYFGAASAARNHQEKTAQNAKSKTLIQVGKWTYPRAKIFLKECTVTSKRFERSVSTALLAPDPFAALQEVFDQYGHVIPSEVTLGGMLIYSEERKEVASAKVDEEQVSIRTKVEGKCQAAAATAGVSFGSGTHKEEGTADLTEFTEFTNKGGDSLLCSNPAEWAPTVKDPKLWSVIEMKNMRPTINLLSRTLKKRVLNIWETRNPEAFGYPVDYPWEENQGAVESSGAGFATAMRMCHDGDRGSVFLAAGPDDDPQEGNPGIAAGAAYTHYYLNGDIHIECNSICMPVPTKGYIRSMFEQTWGNPGGRLIFTPSNLELGGWESFELEPNGEWSRDKDGFVFVSVSVVENGDGMGVTGYIDGKAVASSYIHKWEKDDNRINRQSFCIPVPAGAKFKLTSDTDKWGNPKVNCYWMPLLALRWKMVPAKTVSSKTGKLAESDGILFGRVWATKNGDRGTLKIYTGVDKISDEPVAAASVHWYIEHNRRIKGSSVMVPVKAGMNYRADFKPTSGSPKAEVFWTAIKHR